jgi:ankyrin repeat protein
MDAPLSAPLPEPTVAAFLRAVGTGGVSAVDTMLETTPSLIHGVGPHPFWGGRPQALHVSIETKRRNMFDRLIRAGADVNGRNDEYMHWSPLLLTFSWSQPGMRRTLLRKGARVGLPEALAMGDDETVLRLLRAGPSALTDRVPNDGSQLAFARTPAAIDRLLELGVRTDQRDFWGSTATEALSRLGPKGKPLVRHLIARGIPVEPEAFARLNDGRALSRLMRDDATLIRNPRILNAAVDFGHLELARRLLDLGSDPNGRGGGEADETPLHSAAWNGDRPMVELLLARGADPAIRDRCYDATAAGWAATSIDVSNNPKCRDVVLLLEALDGNAPAIDR